MFLKTICYRPKMYILIKYESLHLNHSSNTKLVPVCYSGNETFIYYETMTHKIVLCISKTLYLESLSTFQN